MRWGKRREREMENNSGPELTQSYIDEERWVRKDDDWIREAESGGVAVGRDWKCYSIEC